jgi:hypothetical protein
MDRLVKQLPVVIDRLRQDRNFEGALANGADPLHLAHVFSLGAESSFRYTSVRRRHFGRRTGSAPSASRSRPPRAWAQI